MNIKRQLCALYAHSFFSCLNLTGAVWVALLAARGFSLWQIGLAESVYHAVSLACEVPSGMAADLLGRRRTLLLGSALAVLSNVPMLLPLNFALVCCGMGLSACANAMLSGTSEALAYDSLKMAGRTGGYLRVEAALTQTQQAAQALGSLASLLEPVWGFAGYYTACIAVHAAEGAAALGLREPVVTQAQAARGAQPIAALPAKLAAQGRACVLCLRQSPVAARLIAACAWITLPTYLNSMFLQQRLVVLGWPEAWLCVPALVCGAAAMLGAEVGRRLRPRSRRGFYAACALICGAGTLAVGAWETPPASPARVWQPWARRWRSAAFCAPQGAKNTGRPVDIFWRPCYPCSVRTSVRVPIIKRDIARGKYMKQSAREYGILFLGVLALSTSAIFVKLADAPSAVTAFYRLLFTTLALAPFLLLSPAARAELRGISAKQLGMIALGGVLLAVNYVLWFESLGLTSVSSSTVLVSLQPLFSLFYDVVLLHQKPRRSALVGCLIAVAGSCVIGWGDFQLSGKALLGDVLSLGAAACVALYFLIGQIERRTLGAVSYSVVCYFCSTVFLLGYALCTRSAFTGYPGGTWAAWVGLALISTVGGQFTFNLLLKKLSATMVTMGILGEPVGTIVLAYFLLDERVSARQLVGIAGILAGLSVFFFYPLLADAKRAAAEKANG